MAIYERKASPYYTLTPKRLALVIYNYKMSRCYSRKTKGLCLINAINIVHELHPLHPSADEIYTELNDYIDAHSETLPTYAVAEYLENFRQKYNLDYMDGGLYALLYKFHLRTGDCLQNPIPIDEWLKNHPDAKANDCGFDLYKYHFNLVEVKERNYLETYKPQKDYYEGIDPPPQEEEPTEPTEATTKETDKFTKFWIIFSIIMAIILILFFL